jgi:uncharacterized RDD family membrane protein YckC
VTAPPQRIAPVSRRLAAVGVDYAVIAVYLAGVTAAGWGLRQVSGGVVEAVFSNPATGELAGFALLTLPVSAYFVFFEAAPAGATWGKRRLGLHVVTDGGRGIGLGRSTVRTAVKFLPWELSHGAIWQFAFAGSGGSIAGTLLLIAAWLLVAITIAMTFTDRRHRALHDRIAGTEVRLA